MYRVQQNYIHCISSFFPNSHDITFYQSSHRGVSATNSRRFHAWLYLPWRIGYRMHCQSSFHHKSDFIRLCLLSSEMLTIHNIVNILTSEHWLDFFSVDKNRPKTVSIHCIQIEQIQKYKRMHCIIIFGLRSVYSILLALYSVLKMFQQTTVFQSVCYT